MSSRSGSPPRAASPSAEAPGWLAAVPGGVVLRVHAQPGATRSSIAGLHGGALKVRVDARPVEGAANAALVRTLAQALAVRPADVSVVAGSRGRAKRVRVDGVGVATVVARLAPFVDKAEGAD
jgi:uncharacterized protein (TIGR00251 family)